MNENMPNIKYYMLREGGIVRVINDVTIHSLDENGFWIPNQYLFSMFVDGDLDYTETSEEMVSKLIQERQKEKGGRKL